jgi:hypothetical protein
MFVQSRVRVAALAMINNGLSDGVKRNVLPEQTPF